MPLGAQIAMVPAIGQHTVVFSLPFFVILASGYNVNERVMMAIKRIYRFSRGFMGKSLLAARVPIAKWKYAGDKKYCPVCESSVSRFLPFGDPPRPDVMCPVCHSLERHRLDWALFSKNTDHLRW